MLYSSSHNNHTLDVENKHKNNFVYIFMKDALKGRMGSIFSQSKGHINKDWVLIDIQSN